MYEAGRRLLDERQVRSILFAIHATSSGTSPANSKLSALNQYAKEGGKARYEGTGETGGPTNSQPPRNGNHQREWREMEGMANLKTLHFIRC